MTGYVKREISQLEGRICNLLNVLSTGTARKGRRRGGLVISALDSRSRGLGSSWPGHCVAFLGKTLYSHSASLHPGV